MVPKKYVFLIGYFLFCIIYTLIILLVNPIIPKREPNDLEFYFRGLIFYRELFSRIRPIDESISMVVHSLFYTGYFYPPWFFLIFNEITSDFYIQMLYPLFVYSNVSSFYLLYGPSLYEYVRYNFDVYVMFFSVILLQREILYILLTKFRGKTYYIFLIFCLFFITLKPQCIIVCIFHYFMFIIHFKLKVNEKSIQYLFIIQSIGQFLFLYLIFPLYFFVSLDFPFNFDNLIFRFYSPGNVLFMCFWILFFYKSYFGGKRK